MTGTLQPRALVVGLGASGTAACLLLLRHGWLVRVNDRAAPESLTESLGQIPAQVERVLGGHPPAALAGVSLVVVSPGVPWDLPLLAEARLHNLEVVDEVELAYRFLADTPLVAVTGSNGKSTVTSWIGTMAESAGQRAGVGANLGTPASALVLTGGWDVMVWELSSFQLEGCTSLRPRVGVLLNISADHLDRHGDLDGYLAAKRRIFDTQQGFDTAVLNADDPLVAAVAPPARRAVFSLTRPSAEAHLSRDTLVLDDEPLVDRRDLLLLGAHNVANALASALAASRAGIPREAIIAGLTTFPGLPHRHRLVAEVRGVRWVDDSKGTNIGATAAGLAGYPPGRIHLILGGLGKGQDFTALGPAMKGRVVRAYLIGAAARELAEALAGAAELEPCGTLETAVARAAAHTRPGDVVLLSPACASFDQFHSYAHRGNEFARLVAALPEVV